jgi:hypothetical protein
VYNVVVDGMTVLPFDSVRFNELSCTTFYNLISYRKMA